MKQLEHTKIINRLAKEAFAPYGIKRFGQSRSWFDDHGWFVTIIEFQPSGFARGTFLNVGVSFNWYVRGHFTYDIGFRESGLIRFNDEEQFSTEVRRLTQIALNKTLQYRKELTTIEAAKTFIVNNKTGDSLWGNYHRGIICALAGDKTKQKEISRPF